MRLRLGRRAACWLLLGPRPDGTLYDKDERAALTGLAIPAGRALGIARSGAEIAALTLRVDALTKAHSPAGTASRTAAPNRPDA